LGRKPGFVPPPSPPPPPPLPQIARNLMSPPGHVLAFFFFFSRQNIREGSNGFSISPPLPGIGRDETFSFSYVEPLSSFLFFLLENQVSSFTCSSSLFPFFSPSPLSRMLEMNEFRSDRLSSAALCSPPPFPGGGPSRAVDSLFFFSFFFFPFPPLNREKGRMQVVLSFPVADPPFSCEKRAFFPPLSDVAGTVG